MKKLNPNCDGGNCTSETSEVRILPLSSMSNLHVCNNCFNHEMAHRKEINQLLAKELAFKIYAFQDLKIKGE